MSQVIENDTRPVAPKEAEKELVFLIDRSKSMTWEVAEGSSAARYELLGEAFGTLIERLEGLDSQAAREQAGGSMEKGGALTFTFASTPEELGDINSANLKAKWASIVWDGGTLIMPAYEMAVNDFVEEFPDPMDRPWHIMVVFTDGEAKDATEFATVMQATKDAKTPRYVIVCTLGHGKEHDDTVKLYQGIAADNKHVRVLQFGGDVSANKIADDILATVNA
jgi:hypothetical protein